ncbi:MAG: uroporphyrinogen decarboxylase family protein [Candidatus Promineifilaceae bacterium]|nr:uroporphyrinogen decarboxylase family protein [Candidatus Promineifilaceae bacterium]
MTKWKKQSRLEAAIAGDLPDRLPVALWRHWPGDDQDADALAAAHLRWQKDYDWDVLKVGPASSYSVADWGAEDRWVGHIEGTRERTYFPIQDISDWQRLQPLDPNQGMLATQIEALRLVKKGVGDEVPILATVFSPLSQAKNLASQELMLCHMRSDPETFRQGLEAITESTIRFVAAAIEAGVSGIFYAVQHARYSLMSRQEFKDFGRQYDLRILDHAQDLWLNMVHIHSDQIMFDLVADYPTQLVNWHDREAEVSLADGLKSISGAASGGIDHWTLHQEAPAAALVEARDAYEQTDGRRLLLGTGCVIMVTTPTRNIRAIREFAENPAEVKS